MKGGRIQELNSNALAQSVLDILEERKKHTIQDKRLQNMTWGMGLEHEAQYFYTPKSDKSKYPINDTVVIDTEKPTLELLEYFELKESNRDLLEKIDFEDIPSSSTITLKDLVQKLA